MQVLLRKSKTTQDIQCSVCRQGFQVYWERTSPAERATMRAIVEAELRHQHIDDTDTSAHPEAPFNLPQWSGMPQFSAAALLGGHSGPNTTVPTRRQSR
jgi:hypothetical protein